MTMGVVKEYMTPSPLLLFLQYYATVDSGHEFCDENIPWLSKAHVEDRSEPDPTSLEEMAGIGHSVGGIVNTSYSGTHVSIQ